MVQPLWIIIWKLLKKLKIELPNDPAIPLLDIYPKKVKTTNLKRYMHPNVHSSIIYNAAINICKYIYIPLNIYIQ